MNCTGEGDKYLICGRSLSFNTSLWSHFIDWYEQNSGLSTSEEICTMLLTSLDIKVEDVVINNLNDCEKLEILNIVAKDNSFTNIPIHSQDEFIQGLDEYYHSHIRNLSGRFEDFMEFIRNLGQLTASVGIKSRRLYENINYAIDLNKIKAFIEFIEKLPDDVKQMHEKLTLQGWYLPLSVLLETKPSYALKIIKSDIAETNYEMLLFAQKIEGLLLPEIKKSFSNRYIHISESLKCHNEENYNLSIPIMLIQADGITLDIFRNHLFRNQAGRKEKIKIVDEDIMDTLCLFPLKIDSSISATEKMRAKKDFHKFNRHEILHGEDLDYGNRENSYRCIMLLKYLIDVNNYINKQHQEID